MKKYNVWIKSVPGFSAQYDGKVTVFADDDDEAIELAFRKLKNGAFPERSRSMWKVEKVERVFLRVGKTGYYSRGEVYRSSSMIPRPAGGLLVLVSSWLRLPPDHPDELRFRTKKDAKEFLDTLPFKSKEEIEEEQRRTGIPF